MKYSIEDLVEKMNSLPFNKDITDGRVSDKLSVRRVRDYQSKGLIKEPEKVGRNSFYNDDHLSQLIALRAMQSTGLTDNFMKNLSLTSPLYYQSEEVKNTVNSQLVNPLSEASQLLINKFSESSNISCNSSQEYNSDNMKNKVLEALKACASPSSLIKKDDNAMQSQKEINAAVASFTEVLNLENIEKNTNSKYDSKIFFEEIANNFPENFIVDPEKEKRHQEKYEARLRQPNYSNVYNVHERVSLEIKTPYKITYEDKSKIIARLIDIINSI